MRIYNIFQNGTKIAEFVEFTDGYGIIHYTLPHAYPKNEYSRAHAIKIACTKNGWKYEEV